MDEQTAEAVANPVGGRTWQSGGDVWLVLKGRADGKPVVISDEAICDYDSQEDFEAGSNALRTIVLN